MASVAIDLDRWIQAGLLRVWAGRPSSYGLELHLATLLRMVDDFAPSIVALDAMTALEQAGEQGQVTSTVTREIDMLKDRGITTVVTSLTPGGGRLGMDTSSLAVMSLMDTWLLLQNVESNGERNRLLFVRKSRGSAHSNQVREFVLTDRGPELLDVYVGARGVLTGSARLAQQAEDRRSTTAQDEEVDRRSRVLARRGAEVDARVAVLRAELEAETAELHRFTESRRSREVDLDAESTSIAVHRWADPDPTQDSAIGDAS
jgi:circadian clock protein KaiC